MPRVTGAIQTAQGPVQFVWARLITLPTVMALTRLQDLHCRATGAGRATLSEVASIAPTEAARRYRRSLFCALGQMAVLHNTDRVGLFQRLLAFVRAGGGHVEGLESLMVSGLAAASAMRRDDLVREGVAVIDSLPVPAGKQMFSGGMGIAPFFDTTSHSLGFFDLLGFLDLPGTFGSLGAALGLGAPLGGRRSGADQGGDVAPWVDMQAMAYSTCVAAFGAAGKLGGEAAGEGAYGPAGEALFGAFGGEASGTATGEIACNLAEAGEALGSLLDELLKGGPADALEATSEVGAGDVIGAGDGERGGVSVDPMDGGSAGGAADDQEGKDMSDSRPIPQSNSHWTATYPKGKGIASFVGSGGPRVLILNDMPELGPGGKVIANPGALSRLPGFLAHIIPNVESDTGPQKNLAGMSDQRAIHSGSNSADGSPITIQPLMLRQRLGEVLGRHMENFLRELQGEQKRHR